MGLIKPPHGNRGLSPIVLYGDYEITVEIGTGVVRGEFPKRALRAVLEWADINQDKLMLDWKLAEQRKPLLPLAPLE